MDFWYADSLKNHYWNLTIFSDWIFWWQVNNRNKNKNKGEKSLKNIYEWIVVVDETDVDGISRYWLSCDVAGCRADIAFIQKNFSSPVQL